MNDLIVMQISKSTEDLGTPASDYSQSGDLNQLEIITQRS